MNWKKFIKIGLAIVLTLGFVVLSFSAKQKRKSEPILDVKVAFQNSELRFITNQEIKSIVNQYREENEIEVEDIDLQHLELAIEKNKYVSDCQAFVDNKHQLKIDVTQREPLFRVIHANGVSYYVDEKGIKFPKSNSFTASVPIITGKVTYQVDSLGVQMSDRINNLVTLINYVNNRDFERELLATVDVKTNGDMVMTSRIEGYQINLGDASNLDDKFHRLKILFREGLPRIGWEKYSQFNLKYKNQIIAT